MTLLELVDINLIKKLALFNRIYGSRAAEDIVNPETGELFVAQGEKNN